MRTGPVFISHSSRDAALAHELVAALEASGVACWISGRDVGPGQNFQEAIVAAIRGGRAMVVLVSAAANASDEVKKELALASAAGVAVYPVRLGAVVPNAALSYELATRQWIEGGDVPVLAARLATAIGGSSPQTSATDAPAALALPDKPSLAVLPFTNMSGDPDQQYFSDGITEDIITELSRFRSLFVIARNSSFQYRGHAVDVRRIGRELGAQYVVEGSVRKTGDRLRVTAQLIEATSGKHLWAERYDRDLNDIFAVQDEVTGAICAAIPGQLDRLAVEHLRRRPPKNLTAYDCELRGRWAYFHLVEGLAAALDWYEQAVEADPTYALAHAGLGMTSMFGILGLGLPPEATLSRGREHARLAVALDERNPTVNAYVAFTYHISGDHRLARRHAERAVSLNPNDPFAIYALGCALSYTGEPEQALEWFAKSERLEPYAPDDQRLDTLCDCHYMLRNYAKVIEIHEVYQNVPAFLYPVLAAAYAQAGQPEEAATAIKSYERLRPPGHDLKTHITYWMRMCSRQSDRDHWLEGFRRAGMDI